MRIEVDIPDSMIEHKAHFEWFVATMVRKLHVNRHKVYPVEGDRWLKLLTGLRDEVQELTNSSGQFEAIIEAVDVANMAWLVALWSCSVTREKFDECQKFEAS